MLFLSELNEIKFEFGGIKGGYSKETRKKYTFGATSVELIRLTKNDGVERMDDCRWLFSRLDDCERKYSVGFFVDDDGMLLPVSEPAFCFFPTKEVTGLNFIIHAPFLLTDSREGIRAGVQYNDNLLKLLAILASDAVVLLKTLGEYENKRLIDDNIIDVIPYNPAQFSDPHDKRKVSFFPFYEAIRNVFLKEEILPSVDGYTRSKNAYWAFFPQLTSLLSSEQLADITDNENAKWVFPSIGRDEIQNANKSLFAYGQAL